MRLLLLAGWLVLAFPFDGAAQRITDSPANRVAAARAYVEKVPVEPMIDRMVAGLAASMPAGDRAHFAEFMSGMVDVERMNRLVVIGLAKHFTVGEINELARFYGSPVGRSIVAKLGPYLADVLPVIQQDVQAGFRRWYEEVVPRRLVKKSEAL